MVAIWCQLASRSNRGISLFLTTSSTDSPNLSISIELLALILFEIDNESPADGDKLAQLLAPRSFISESGSLNDDGVKQREGIARHLFMLEECTRLFLVRIHLPVLGTPESAEFNANI